MLRKATRKFTTTLSSPGIIDAVADTFTLANTTNLPTDTQVDLTIDRVDSSGTLTPAKEEVITGTVSGSNIIGAIRGVEGTAQAHSAGAVVEVRLTASQWNDAIDEMIRLRSNNYQIVPTVSGNNLTVALKTLSGNDPSALDPINVRIGNTIRTITSALSTTVPAGFSFYNAGSAELATKEVDYFVYLGRVTADSTIKIGFARMPYATLASEFSDTASVANDKYIRWDATASVLCAAMTEVVNIGRFAATLSAGAGYTWTVPTFTEQNLVNRPIGMRFLDWQPVYSTGGAGTYTSVTTAQAKYRLNSEKTMEVILFARGTTNSTDRVTATLPFSYALGAGGYPQQYLRFPIMYSDGAFELPGIAQLNGNSNIVEFRSAWTSGANRDIGMFITIPLI